MDKLLSPANWPLSKPLTRCVLALLFTAVFVLLILPINERIAFDTVTLRKALYVSYALKVGFAIALFLVTYFFLTFLSNWRAGSARHRAWLKISATYLAIMSVFFVLLYPGAWVWDEFSILDAAKEYSLYSWQHYFTNIYYTFSMYLAPTAVSIVVVQLVFISLVVGYVISLLQPLFKRQRLPYLLFAIFLLPAVILNNFYPLRMTVYAYLVLLLVVKLYVLHVNKYVVSRPFSELFQYSVIIAILAFWRTEGFYFALLLPWLFFMMRKQLTRPTMIAAAICSLLFIGTGYGITRYTNDPLYSLTAIVNPLSVMLQQPLDGDDIESKLAAIDKVIDIEAVKAAPAFDGIPAFYKPNTIREGFAQHMPEAQKAYAYIILHNPDDFLHARLMTLLSTNTFGDRFPFVDVGTLAYRPHPDPLIEKESQEFIEDNLFAAPLNYGVKKRTTLILLQYTEQRRPTALNHIFWNALPALAGVLILGIWQFIRRQYIWTLLCSLLLAGATALFLTAPANFFMYYFPAYLVGYFLLLLKLLEYIDKKRHRPAV